MLYLTVLLTLVGLAAGVLDLELDAKYLTMPPSDFIDYFNEQDYSWKIKQYGIDITVTVDSSSNTSIIIKDFDELPVKEHDPKIIGDLPENFDSRERWPHCDTIREIYNQYFCESCWAHGVANTASDRICIQDGLQIRLSEQDLECSHPHQTICHSGNPVDGFRFWKNIGLVSRECKPYEPEDLNRNTCVRFCRYNPSLRFYLENKHFAEEIYHVRNETYQIKAELVTNGPIQAVMKIYSDFAYSNQLGRLSGYSSGIYEHKHGEFVGLHSVRVIGYGVENGVDYWLVANSWGSKWGEKGYFRIKASQEYIDFEQLILAGIPEKVNLTNYI